MKIISQSVGLVVLAVIADVALVVNVYRHWNDKPPEIIIGITCQSSGKMVNCMAYNKAEEE